MKRKNEAVAKNAAPRGKLTLYWGRSSSRAWVEGTEKILLCTDTQVVILLGGARCAVTGTGLSCLTYASGAVEITGKIAAVGSGEENADL